MQVSIRNFALDELRELADSGKPIAWQGEEFRFSLDARTLIFTLDNLGQARLRTVVVDDRHWFIETLSRVLIGKLDQEETARRLLTQAIAYLRDERGVSNIEVFDRPSGMLCSHPVEELIRFASASSGETGI